MVETTFEDALEEGKVTPEQRKAVHNVNGHTSATTASSYVKRKREHDAVHAAEAFRSVIPRRDTIPVSGAPQHVTHLSDRAHSLSDRVAADFSPSVGLRFPMIPTKGPGASKEELFQYDDWGTKYTGSWANQRATWTDAEILWVGHYKTMHPRATAQMIRDAIIKDPSARAIFHRFHVEKHERITHALKEYQKKCSL